MANNTQRGPKKPKDTTKRDGVRVASSVAGAVASTAHAVKSVLDLATLIRNHPEWYTHYDTANLVNLNLADKQGVTYPASVGTTPAYTIEESDGWRRNWEAGLAAALGMPAVASYATLVTIPQGDKEGWRTGIRLLFQQLRTANAGRVNFSLFDLEKYVHNVRLLVAMQAEIKRLYEMTYTFRSTNAFIPENMIYSQGYDFNDMMQNAADLYMYVQRFSQQIKVSFPLSIDLFARTAWMFGNVFCDAEDQKPSFYIIHLAPNGGNESSDPKNVTNTRGNVYFTSYGYHNETNGYAWQIRSFTKGVKYGQGYMTFAQLVEAWEEVKNNLLNDTAMSIIAADIIKAYGDRSFIEYDVPKIDQAAKVIYDEDALAQFQNMNILGTYYWEYDVNLQLNSTETPMAIPAVSASSSGVSDAWALWNYNLQTSIQNSPTGIWANAGWADMDTSTEVPNNNGITNIDAALQTVQATHDEMIRRQNDYLLNWHRNDINSGEILSLTRLVISGATLQSMSTSAGYPQHTTDPMHFSVFATEVVVSANVFVPTNPWVTGKAPIPIVGGTRSIDLLTGAYFMPFAGRIYIDLQRKARDVAVDSTVPLTYVPRMMFGVGIVNWLWAVFDWAPRLEILDSIGGVPCMVTPQILDWNVFARIDSDSVGTYQSYANQSLLYAGRSQNQSDVDVYMHASTRQGQAPLSTGRNRTHSRVPQDKS